MSAFSLSVKPEKVFSHEVELPNGDAVPVDPDFRTVLKCIRVLQEPDAKDSEKLYLLMRWFFKGRAVDDPLAAFLAFVSTGEKPDGEPPTMDFEQDADAIYSSFLSQYGIDLVDIPFMHWRRFQALLGGLGEGTALQGRIALRTLDTSKLKGDEKIRLDKAKRRVALKERMSAEAQELQKQLDDVLASGGNPSAALAALQAYYERR